MSLFHAGICFSQSLRYRCCWIQCKHSTSMGSSFSGLSENSACNRTLRPAYRHPVVIPGQSEQVIWVRAPQTLGKEQCILVEPLEGLSTVAVARSLGTVCRDRVPIEVRNRNHFFYIIVRGYEAFAIFSTENVDIQEPFEITFEQNRPGIAEVGVHQLLTGLVMHLILKLWHKGIQTYLQRSKTS